MLEVWANLPGVWIGDKFIRLSPQRAKALAVLVKYMGKTVNPEQIAPCKALNHQRNIIANLRLALLHTDYAIKAEEDGYRLVNTGSH